ncbi:MAG: efflux transporter outer membrane subunit [Acidobacteriaceae bacterium]|nr:efflux transporter outer membrane subunit [Acidobacteriaceae bacterium]
MQVRTLSAALLLLLPIACKVGPNYKRPALSVPDQYRGVAPPLTAQQPSQPAPPQPQESFGDMKWVTVFQDETLQSLIKEALTNNYDIRIAAARILEAGANVGIVRANQFPTLNGSFTIQTIRNYSLFGNTKEPTFDTALLQLNYIVDFWGQYRRATEAARAQLLGTKYAQDVVRTSLVASVANAYFQLRAFDSQLESSKQTLAGDKEIVRINTIKFKGGESALTDVLQAELLQQQAEAEIISLTQGIEQTENQISILLGRNPGAVLRGTSLREQPHMPEIPPGLPSAILERRPDIREAEQNLVAFNANVGVAKAAFFPQIALTGTFGASSTALTSFLQGPATVWALGGQVVQPLFQGGRITSNYRLAWAQRDEAELTYKRTVQQAFGDVSNSLVGYTQSRQYRIKIQEQTDTYKQTADLANVRFLGGYTAFLEVLVTQQQYFESEISLDQAWLTELQNYVGLYQALGGGWQQ